MPKKTVKKKNLQRIEIITWIDATGGDGWLTKKELDNEQLIPFDMVGYVFSEDKDCVKLTMAYDEITDHIGAYIVIPKSMIKKRKVIYNEKNIKKRTRS